MDHHPLFFVKIYFEGVVGKSYRGDISLDDVWLEEKPCPPAGSCTFELGLCTWQNQRNGNNKMIQDDFDWTLGSGSTWSSFTGPSSDHTTGSSLGRYWD